MVKTIQKPRMGGQNSLAGWVGRTVLKCVCVWCVSKNNKKGERAIILKIEKQVGERGGGQVPS